MEKAMSQTATIKRPSLRSTAMSRRMVVAVLAAVVGLGALLMALESDLSGEPIPEYLSSEDFDLDAYEQRFDADEPVCGQVGETILSGQVDCIGYDDHGGVAFAAVLVGLAAAGAALVGIRHNAAGWPLMLAPLSLFVGAAGGAYAMRGTVIDPGSLPVGELAALLSIVGWTLLLVVVVPRLLMTIPDGRLVSERWRWAIGFTYVVAALMILVTALHPMLLGAIPNPIGLPWSVETADSVIDVMTFGMIGCWAIGGLALVVRTVGLLRRHLAGETPARTVEAA